jgi:hypothetical protein
MALEVGVNSYASVDDASTYFESRLDVAAWTSATNAQKEAALVTATTVLDNKRWAGYAVDASQALAFPRVLSYMDPKVGDIVTLPEDTIPKRVLEACYETAYHLLNNDGALDNVSSVKSLSIGPIKLENIGAINNIPSIANTMIQPLLDPSFSSRTWWRAN